MPIVIRVTKEKAQLDANVSTESEESPDVSFFPFGRLPPEMKWLVLRNLDTSELLIVALVADDWKVLVKKILENRQQTINLSSLVQGWPGVTTGEFMTGNQLQDILRSLAQLKLNLGLTVDDDVETQELLQEAGSELFCAGWVG